MRLLTSCAGPDAVGSLLLEFMGQARRRLDVAVYEITEDYTWVLRAAARRGVAVRLLLDRHGNTAEMAAAMAEAGAEVRAVHLPNAYLHEKVVLVDDRQIGVGTGNLTQRDAPYDHHHPPQSPAAPLAGTREWWILGEGYPSLVAAARSHFASVWHLARPGAALSVVEEMGEVPPIGAPLPFTPPLVQAVSSRRLHLCVGSAAIHLTLTNMIAGASRRVLVTVPYVWTAAPRVRLLLEALVAARGRGVDVRLLLGASPQVADADGLQRLGVVTSVMDPQRCTTGHAKGLVADGEVLVGSANWSQAGLSHNDEIGLRVRQDTVADYFASLLLRDWDSSIPLVTSSPLSFPSSMGS